MRGPERRGLVPFFWMFVTLLSLPPAVVGLDIQDEMGRHEVGHIDNSMRIPLNNGVGCRFEGQFSINKVQRPCLVPSHLAPHPRGPLPPWKLDGGAVCPLALPRVQSPGKLRASIQAPGSSC